MANVSKEILDQQPAAILGRAIQKAIDGGWNCFYTDLNKWDWHLGEGRIYPLFMYFTPNESVGLIAYTSQNYDVNRVIFNHEFAKALWPWDDTIKCPYCDICLTGSLMHPRPCPFGVAEVFALPMWQYHLQQMVIAEDPIKYLGENI